MSVTFLSTSFLNASFNGRSGPGSISVPGVKVGDVIMMTTAGGNPIASQFASIISTDDEVQQLYSGDSTADTFIVFILRSATA